MAIGSQFQLSPFAATPSPPPVGFFSFYVQGTTIYLQDSSGNIYAFGSTNAIEQLTGDVTATGPGVTAATVVAIQGSAVSNVGPLDAQFLVWSNSASKYVAVNISGDATMTAPGVLTVSDTAVTSKLLTGLSTGPATDILATDTILQALEKLQAQVNLEESTAITALTGDVSATGPGSAAATIQPNVVDNSKLAQMPASTIKGNDSGSPANAADLTGTQVTALLTPFIGDSGSGGVQGLVPAPAQGDTQAGKFLSADGTWEVFPVSGELVSFFYGTASDIGGYLVMGSAPPGGSEVYVTDNSPLNGQIIQSFATAPLNPGVSFIPNGVVSVSVHAYKTGGSKNVQLYAEIYKRDVSNVETLIATTNNSVLLPTVEVNLTSMNTIIPDTFLGLTDRIVVKIRETITGSGSNPTSVTIGFAGVTAARASAPGTTVPAITSLVGDVAAVGPGNATATIQPNVVDNTKLAQAPANTLKGNNTGVTANESDLTISQVIAMLGTITALTGDVSASGPGSSASTVNSVGGSSAANIHSAELAANAATSLNTASTIVKRDASGNFAMSALTLSSFIATGTSDLVQGIVKGFTGQASDIFQVLKADNTIFFKVDASGNGTLFGTISASNFSGSSSGTNTGDVTKTDTDSIALILTGQALSANLRLSVDPADAGNVKATTTIHSGANPGLHVELPFGNPVNIGTSNNPGSATSFSLSDHIHAISSTVVLGLLLTGYVVGTNTPLAATNSILIAFQNIQGQINATNAAAVTSLTGDVTGTGPGATATTISVGAVTDTKGSLSNKPAVTVVATTNQALSGTPTIDGQATTAGTSIALLTAQTTASQNGPWVVQTGAWTRPTWFPSGGTTQSFQFITALVRLGTVYGGSTWRQTTAAPVIIDTTATAWAVIPLSGNFKSEFDVGPQSGSSDVILAFKNAFTGSLAWNPTVSHTVKLPPTQGAAGTVPTNDGSGNLSWSNPNTNIDGGKANSVYTPSQFINGGTA